jgi:THUMP domain-like
MAWFGEMANSHNKYVATLLHAGKVFQYSSSERDILPDVGELSNYIYDPAPSLLAAKLLGALAQELNFQSLTFAGVYLTSDVCVQHPFLTPFEVVAILPLDVTQLRRYCREQNIGTVEIKQRNVGILPEQLRPQLKLTGDNATTLILCNIGDRKQAVVCKRVE